MAKEAPDELEEVISSSKSGDETRLKFENKRLRKIIEHQSEALKERAKVVIPPKKNKSKGSFLRVVIPDTHGAHIDPEAAGAFLGDLKELKPKEVVLLGDHIDAGGFLAQHHVMGYVAETSYSFRDDVEAANHFLDSVVSSSGAEQYHYLNGNHECFCPEAEVLTAEGFKKIEDVTCEDFVAQLNGTEIFFGKPKAVHCSEYSGEVIELHGNGPMGRVTPNHRIAHYGQKSEKLQYRTAGDFTSKTAAIRIPCAAKPSQEDMPGITDDEIRLVAWLLTDGSVGRNQVIYQSKPEHVKKIRGLLERSGLKFREYSRAPKATEICGVQLKSKLQAYEFHLKDRVERAPDTRVVPGWAWNLSDRQFRVFFQTIKDADASIGSGMSSGAVYGGKQWLDSLQAYLSAFGMRTKLSWKVARNSHWALNFAERDRIKVESKRATRTQYTGPVYCLTTATENFFVRCHGRVYVTGNSRLHKWCVTQTLRHNIDAEYLAQLFAPEKILHLEKRKINFYSMSDFHMGLRIRGTIKLGQCHFTHGSNTSKHAASKMVDVFGGNVVFGHIHRAQSHIRRTVHSGAIGAWCPGCLCKIQPYWMHTSLTDWSHGYGLQVVQTDGTFLHINVPIVDGVSLLQPLISRLGG